MKRRFRAISLKQPWANLVAEGKKTIETRKWTTKYRGDLVICSSQSPKIEPYGHALCVVDLYCVRPMTKEDEKQACCDIHPRAQSWLIRNLRLFKPTFPVKGKLSIYEIVLPNNTKIIPFQ